MSKIKKYPAFWLKRHRTGNIRDHPQRYHINVGKRYSVGNFGDARHGTGSNTQSRQIVKPEILEFNFGDCLNKDKDHIYGEIVETATFETSPYTSETVFLIRLADGYGWKKGQWGVVVEWRQKGHSKCSDCDEATISVHDDEIEAREQYDDIVKYLNDNEKEDFINNIEREKNNNVKSGDLVEKNIDAKKLGGHYRIKNWEKGKSESKGDLLWRPKWNKYAVVEVVKKLDGSWNVVVPEDGAIKILTTKKRKEEALKFAIKWMKKHPNGV